MRRLICILFLLTAGFDLRTGAQAPVQPRAFLLFFDDLHLEFQNTPWLRRLAMRLRSLIHDGDVWAIVTTGTSSVSVAPTSNSELLDSTIGRITGNGLAPKELLDARQQPNLTRELRHRAAIAFSTAVDAVNYMARAPERTPFVVLYFSNGYDTRLIAEPIELIEAANRANAAIYTIDPRGLTDATGQGVTTADWDAYLEATRDSLRTLASRTQGMAVFTADDLDTLLSHLEHGAESLRSPR